MRLWALAVMLGSTSFGASEIPGKVLLKGAPDDKAGACAITASGPPNGGYLIPCAMAASLPDDDWPLVIPQGWRGFALLGNQSYVLRINIETIMSLGPEEIRQLLAYNARSKLSGPGPGLRRTPL